MKKSPLLVIISVCFLLVAAARAADPVKVDPKHYSVEFENDTVRILRIHYGPGEKSVMHEHPAAVAIYLTDAESKMTFADGTSKVSAGKAGKVESTPGGAHLPENVGTKPMELILVEFKTPPAAK